MTTIAAAMVLAAGRGERMRPLSAVVPKPALPLPDGPVIASALRLARDTGISNVVVNTWHLAERMAAAVAELDLAGLRIEISCEATLMGTAGGLARARARGLLGSHGPVLVINGDGALGLDLELLVARHLGSDDLATLALLPHLDPQRWSQVALDPRGLVRAFRPPGPPADGEVPLLYPGVMMVSREALAALPDRPGEIPDALWYPALERERLGGAMVTGHWREVGTPRDYLALVVKRLGGRTRAHPSATVDPTAVACDSFIGSGSRVAARAAVLRSVIAEGAQVAAGSRVEDSVLLGRVRTRPDEVVRGEFRAVPAPRPPRRESAAKH